VENSPPESTFTFSKAEKKQIPVNTSMTGFAWCTCHPNNHEKLEDGLNNQCHGFLGNVFVSKHKAESRDNRTDDCNGTKESHHFYDEYQISKGRQ
jgi:hypothetical protein